MLMNMVFAHKLYIQLLTWEEIPPTRDFLCSGAHLYSQMTYELFWQVL